MYQTGVDSSGKVFLKKGGIIEMKKVILLVLGTILLTTLVASPVLADPPWYNGVPGGYAAKEQNAPPWTEEKVKATDALVDMTGGSASGFVSFVCETQEGFDYSVDVKGLATGQYDVIAIPLEDEPEFDFPNFPAVIFLTSDDAAHGPYDLGSINIGGKGEGELEGVVSLPPGFYLWQIVVVDSGDVTVLSTLPSGPPISGTDWFPDPTPGDHAGFIVFP
jgi:hypothetical protein